MKKVGPSFSDFVIKDSGSRKRRGGGNYDSDLRSSFPLFLLIVIFFVIFVRLFNLQIVMKDYYRNLSDGNRTKVENIPAERGIIFDRNNKPLVRNVPAFKKVDGDKVTWLSKDEALNLISQGKDKNLQADTQREYLYKDIFSHVLGYTGQITKEQLLLPKYQDYKSGDFVGKMGLEKEYEPLLKGKDGKELYEVDAKGKVTRLLGREEPVAGQDIKTTLDLSLQLAAYDATSEVKKGAVIVSDPRDGSILALVSKPSFDPNLFTHSDNYKSASSYSNISQILTDNKNQPLLNRVIGGTYPPGSTFKLITAAAGLESGGIKPDTKVEDTGVLKVGTFSFGNWYYSSYGRTEGQLDVVGALKRSNDIFFYKTAEWTGVDKLAAMSKKFGLGEPLGIDLLGEEGGTVPTPLWKKEKIGDNWYLGDTYHFGIGQGYLLTTPLQVNFWADFFANEGTLYQPHILQEDKKVLAKDFVKKENINIIREGMKEACSTGGVAWPFFDFKVKNDHLTIDNKDFTEDASGSAKMVKVAVGCKTGTAETYGTQNPHSWITVFAPFYNPEISVTVLVENGGEGSNVAGPIAEKILRKYFEEK